MLWVLALCYSKPFPSDKVVASGLIVVVALGFLVMTSAEYWMGRIPVDFGLIMVGLVGTLCTVLLTAGYMHEVVGGPLPARNWMVMQASAAGLALLASAVARIGIPEPTRD
jgi:hypothetical protein